MTHRGVKYWPFSPLELLFTKYSKASSMIVEVGVEEFVFFKRADADLKVIGGELDAVVLGEDTAPLLSGLVEEDLNVGLELCGSVVVSEA